MGCKAIIVYCVMHIIEPSALIEKRRGSPRCSWFDWQHIVSWYLVNHNIVLCKRSRFYNTKIEFHNWVPCCRKILNVDECQWLNGYACCIRSHYYCYTGEWIVCVYFFQLVFPSWTPSRFLTIVWRPLPISRSWSDATTLALWICLIIDWKTRKLLMFSLTWRYV